MRGWIWLARGDLGGALQDADAGLEHARVAKEPQVLYPSLAFRARALLAAGREQEAGTEANKLLAMLARLGVLPTAPDWSGDLAVVLQALGRGLELVEFLADAKTPTGWGQDRHLAGHHPLAPRRSGRRGNGCRSRR